MKSIMFVDRVLTRIAASLLVLLQKSGLSTDRIYWFLVGTGILCTVYGGYGRSIFLTAMTLLLYVLIYAVRHTKNLHVTVRLAILAHVLICVSVTLYFTTPIIWYDVVALTLFLTAVYLLLNPRSQK